MPWIDTQGAEMVRRLRVQEGLSPEAMAKRINAQAHLSEHGGVDPFTIRRIEGRPERREPGMVPSARVARVIADFFGLQVEEIWRPEQRVYVPGERRRAA